MYKINNEEFKTKKDLTNYCRSLIERNLYKDIVGDDYLFITNLLKHHDKYELKISNMKSLTAKHHKENFNTKSLFINYEDGTFDDVSWKHCVDNIKKQ